MTEVTQELRERKRELLARIRQEQARVKDGGDQTALFLAKEELRMVRMQLKAYTPTAGKPHRGAQICIDGQMGPVSLGRDLYTKWRQEDTAGIEIDAEREGMRLAARKMQELVTERQAQILSMALSGMRVGEIARAVGVHPSTVSRTLKRGKVRLQNAAEKYRAVLSLYGVESEEQMPRSTAGAVDFGNRLAREVFIKTLTECQSVYFFLHYGEGLKISEIARLAGRDMSTITHTVQRAVKNLDGIFGAGGVLRLKDMGALDQILHETYCQYSAQIDALSPERKQTPNAPPMRIQEAKRTAPAGKQWGTAALVEVVVEQGHSQGKLLQAIREERGKPSVIRWIAETIHYLKLKLRRRRK